MRNSTIHSVIRILAIVLGITVASQASARYFHNPSAAPQYKVVKIEAPATGLSVFGTFNTAGPELGMLRIPMMPSAMTTKTGLFDGGHEGDDDTTDGGDTTHHGGPGDGDTTDMGGDHGHDGDNDTSDSGNAGDTTHCGDHGGNGDHDGNDTVDCGHHGHADNDDSTAVGDTTLHTLFGGGHQSIIVKSHGSGANVVLQFTNNLSTSVTVSNMSLVSGKNFTIISGAPTAMKPVRLSPGRSISVKVAFKASDYALHTDQLQVSSNSAQPVSSISLSGVQVAAASVSNSIPAGVTITALPNPMTSRLKVDLTGISSAAVVIYDISGRTVLSTSITSSEWIWNGTATDGSMLVAGTYIVRISGMSTEGAPYITTQKIVLAR
jgi:hypothetical protein